MAGLGLNPRRTKAQLNGTAVNPLLFQAHLKGRGGLNRDGVLIWEGGLLNLEKTMVSVLHKELEHRVDKLK